MTDDIEETTTPKRKAVTPEILDELDLPWEPERYDMVGCAVPRRDGSEDFPFDGMSVWLSPYTPASLTEAGSGFTASGGNRMADAFVRLRKGLSQVVAAHDLMDPNTGELYPQWWHDPEALEDVPSQVLFYVWSLAISGEPPEDRPKGSSRGRRGTSTRATTARRSKS